MSKLVHFSPFLVRKQLRELPGDDSFPFSIIAKPKRIKQ